MSRASTPAFKNLHVPLPPHLFDALRAESARLKRPATAIAREAVEALLRERRRQALEEEISAYAVDVGGTSGDLDEELERTVLATLRDGGAA